MKHLIRIAALASAIGTAQAAELTLNDLPGVLGTIRQCGYFSCKYDDSEVWASIKADGGLVIYYKVGKTSVYGYGRNVNQAIQSLAVQLNENINIHKETLEKLTPLLPTQ